MRFGAFTAASATGTLVLGAVVSLAPGQNAAQPLAEKPAPASQMLKFDHDQHAGLDNPVDIAACGSCHGSDKTGLLAQPGEVGHQPCLSSGCHADDFLSVGARTKKESPERYAKAAGFCRGCHDNGEGQAPSPFQKAKANNTYLHNDKPGHYLEFNHLRHTKRTDCRSCHLVDAKTYELDAESPGHRECATCHKDNEEQGMPQCAGCHRAGSPSSYYKERKFRSDVRSCNSDRYQKLVTDKKRPPCFKHERKEHRFRDEGQPVECKDCHFMFQSKSYRGHNYQTLRQIKQAPLMDNTREKAHRKCGASGCHAGAVNESRGTGQCALCHSEQSLLNGLVSGGGSSGRSSGKHSSGGDSLGNLLEGSDAPRKKKHRKRDSLKDLVD